MFYTLIPEYDKSVFIAPFVFTHPVKWRTQINSVIVKDDSLGSIKDEILLNDTAIAYHKVTYTRHIDGEVFTWEIGNFSKPLYEIGELIKVDLISVIPIWSQTCQF